MDDDTMRGVHFKYYAFEFPPNFWFEKNPVNGNLTFKGYGASFVENLAYHYQLSLEYVLENSSEVAKIGQAAAAFQAVAKKKVDFSTFPYPPTIELWQIMDFTTLVMQQAWEFLVQWPEEESRLTAVIRPFHLSTWILILVSSLVFAVFMAIIIPFLYGYWKNDNNQGEGPLSLAMIWKGIMYTFAIFTQHGADPNFIGVNTARRFSLRLMLALWLLMTVVLSNLYMSTITSYMTAVKLEPIPNSLQELVSRYEQNGPECLLTIQKNHPLLPKFYNTNQTTLRKIGEWITQNPKFMMNSIYELTNKIVNHSCVQIGVPMVHAFNIGKYYQLNGKCGMTISKLLAEIEFWTLSYQLQKDSPYTKAVNKYLLRAINAGLPDLWVKWSYPNIDKCKLDNNDDGEVRPIKLVELSSAFLVLGVGVALSSLAFFAECLMTWRFFSK